MNRSFPTKNRWGKWSRKNGQHVPKERERERSKGMHSNKDAFKSHLNLFGKNIPYMLIVEC